MELPLDDKEKRKELMKEYRGAIAKNKKLAAIGKEIKAFCTKYPLP